MDQTSGRSFFVRIGIVVLLVLIGVALWFLPGVRSWFTSVFSQQEVRSYKYLGVENGRGVLYEVGLMGIEKRSYEGFSIVDYVKAGDVEVAILKDSNGSHDVYRVDGGCSATTNNGWSHQKFSRYFFRCYPGSVWCSGANTASTKRLARE